MSQFQPRRELLEQRFGSEPVSFEIIPPTVNQPEEDRTKRNRILEKLGDTPSPDLINIPEVQPEEAKDEDGKRRSDFEPRVAPRDYVRDLRDRFRSLESLPAIINRVIVNQTAPDQESWLYRTYHDFHVENIVIVGGESSDEQYPGPTVTEGNRMVRTLNSGTSEHGHSFDQPTNYLVGNITIPSRRGKSPDEPERMIRKISSGADFFTSQILLVSDRAEELLNDLGELLNRRNIPPPMIFWSFTPVQQQKDIDFLRWLGVVIPDSVEQSILSSDDPLETSFDRIQSIWDDLNRVNQALEQPFPMGVNISFMGLRNLDPARRLADRLKNHISR